MTNNILRYFWLYVFTSLWSCWAHAGGLDRLDAFIKTVRTGRAEFVQVVTPPVRVTSGEGQGATVPSNPPRIKKSSGTFEFSRPNRFRFDYRAPFEQRIVADGQTLWMFDVELNQVSARKQAAVLGSTPAALLASATDLAALQTDFVLTDAPTRDGMDWLQAVPKARDGALQMVRLGFQGSQPAALEITDSFGQKSTITFAGFAANVAIDSSRFQFRPPEGADVIRQ